jgi:hypothetical protein
MIQTPLVIKQPGWSAIQLPKVIEYIYVGSVTARVTYATMAYGTNRLYQNNLNTPLLQKRPSYFLLLKVRHDLF